MPLTGSKFLSSCWCVCVCVRACVCVCVCILLMPVFKRVTCWLSNNMLHLFVFISLDLQEPWSSYYFKTEKHQAFCLAVVFWFRERFQMDVITHGVNVENGLGSFTHHLPASCRNYHQLNVQKSAPTPGDQDVTPPGGKGLPSLLWVCAFSSNSITIKIPGNLPGRSIRLWVAPHRHRQISLGHPCDARGMLLDVPSGKGEPKLFQTETYTFSWRSQRGWREAKKSKKLLWTKAAVSPRPFPACFSHPCLPSDLSLRF